MRPIISLTVAQAFVTQWVWTSAPQIWILSDNGTQFTLRIFQYTFRILRVLKAFTTTYYWQPNVQFEISIERYSKA